MSANTPDYRGYHACPCRDCFEIAIGGHKRTRAEREAIADLPRDPASGRFQARMMHWEDVPEEDPTLPALCSECEDAGCSPDGDSECCAPGAYGGCCCEDGEACDECSPNDGADLILAMEGE